MSVLSKVFPDEFIWGVSTASYQIEGATKEDGRGETIWDRFSHIPGNIKNNDTGDVACDHYHRYKEDIQIMREMGIRNYRFSIAWSRIFPRGYGEMNQKGLEFYSNLVDELLANDIEPFITLYHWDLPQALQNEGGWTNRATAQHFANYCEVVFKMLGDRVKNWMTLNEPWVAGFGGYYFGSFAPGIKDFSAALEAIHNQLRGHGLAVQCFRNLGLDGEIGIVLNLCPREASSKDIVDVEAAKRNDGFANRWFLDALYNGKYPEDMKQWYEAKGVVLPNIVEGDMELICTPFDFLGINYYYIEYTKSCEGNWPLSFEVSAGDRPTTLYGWPVTEWGLTQLLVRLQAEYMPKKMYVSENGASYLDTVNVRGEVLDEVRVDYFERHINACHDAILQGANLKGYFAWSLLDNFEWDTGYYNRFGLVYVDRESCDRIIKSSGRWYSKVIQKNGLKGEKEWKTVEARADLLYPEKQDMKS